MKNGCEEISTTLMWVVNPGAPQNLQLCLMRAETGTGAASGLSEFVYDKFQSRAELSAESCDRVGSGLLAVIISLAFMKNSHRKRPPGESIVQMFWRSATYLCEKIQGEVNTFLLINSH